MKHERMRCLLGENNIGAPRMENDYGAIKLFSTLKLQL